MSLVPQGAGLHPGIIAAAYYTQNSIQQTIVSDPICSLYREIHYIIYGQKVPNIRLIL